MSFERHAKVAFEQCGTPTQNCVCKHNAFDHRGGGCALCGCGGFNSQPCRYRKGKCRYHSPENFFKLESPVDRDAIARATDHEERERIPDPSVCGVYFIRCEDFIKIGKSTNVTNRHRALQAAGPFDLHLVAFVPCRSNEIDALEGRMHRRFRRLHHRGEWFRLESPLAEFIEALKSNG